MEKSYTDIIVKNTKNHLVKAKKYLSGTIPKRFDFGFIDSKIKTTTLSDYSEKGVVLLTEFNNSSICGITEDPKAKKDLMELLQFRTQADLLIKEDKEWLIALIKENVEKIPNVKLHVTYHPYNGIHFQVNYTNVELYSIYRKQNS